MNFSDAKKIAQALGFSRIADIRGQSNIKQLFDSGNDGKNKPLVGLYLQIRHDDMLYIGKTTNLVRRSAAHREAGILVAYLAFLPMTQKRLQSAEERMILKAKQLNFRLMNIVVNREVLRNEDGHFDDFMSIDSQDNFIKNVIEGNTYAGRWANLRHRASPSDCWDWDRLYMTSYRPDTQLIVARSYLINAIPDFKDCFGTYLLCTIPNKRRDSIRKTMTLNAGMNNVFEIFYNCQAPRQLFCNIMLDPGVLYESFKTPEAIRATFPWINFEIPKAEPERTVDELLEQSTKQNIDITFPSPSAKKAYLSRRLTHVNVHHLAVATIPIDAVEDALSDRIFMTAAALAAVASMRYSKPLMTDNNQLLMLKLCPEKFD